MGAGCATAEQKKKQIPIGNDRKNGNGKDRCKSKKPIQGYFPFATLEGQDDGEKQATATSKTSRGNSNAVG